jgi:non-specific serine/threonine protein kinase
MAAANNQKPGGERAAAPDTTWLPPSPLPVPLTEFVGRAAEREQVRALIGSPKVRLLTLVGPGGVGKTRLALHAAGDAEAGFDGVAFVDLAPLTDAGQVLPAIERGLGVLDVGPLPRLERVAAAIGEGRLLLVLDNLEQVIGCGPELTQLLRACPGVTILATSRAPLRVAGEHEYPVPPLGREDALALFAERARAVRPSFALTEENEASVAAVCRELDGLPLAIELAAARSKVLGPDGVLGRLGRRLDLLTGGPLDAPGRQRSLRDAIAWSYELLDEQEQRLFRRLAVFAGGFGLDAADAICGESVLRDGGWGETPSPSPMTHHQAPSVFDGIASLVDKNLLQPALGAPGELDMPRFGMLETVREFALEQLVAAGELAVARDRHAAWCVAFVEEVGVGLAGPAATRLAQRLDAEIPNLVAALDWLVERGRADDALRLAAAPWLYWMMRARMREGWHWLQRALAIGGADPIHRARALGVAGSIAGNLGIYDFAARVEEGFDLARAAGDKVGEARTLFALGGMASGQNEHERAIALSRAALVLLDEIGDSARATMTLANLGAIARRIGDDERARVYLEDAVARARAQGFGLALGYTLNVLGRIARQRGDTGAAYAMYRESLHTAAQMRDRLALAFILLDGIAVAAASGDAERAARLAGAAESLREAIGSPARPSPAHATGADYDRTIAAIRLRLGEERFAAAWAAGRAMSVAEVIDEAAAGAELPARPRTAESGPRRAPNELSARELEVLALVVAGQTDRQIGDALFISPRTAQVHVANILGKLGVSTRAAAAAIAVRDGLVAELPAAN